LMLQKLFRPPQPPEPTAEELALADIDKQIKRLAKELFRTNTLAESQTEQTRQAVEVMKAMLSERQKEQKSSQEAVQAVRVDTVKALFPVVDSIEAGISSGATLLKALTAAPPEVTAALAGWLDGQRLIVDRLDTILQAEGIQRMQTVGQRFDPHYHVATQSMHDPTQPTGAILKEERRGYLSGSSVLRYAEVVVNRNGGTAG
jgi:molecular chaperone GrpE